MLQQRCSTCRRLLTLVQYCCISYRWRGRPSRWSFNADNLLFGSAEEPLSLPLSLMTISKPVIHPEKNSCSPWTHSGSCGRVGQSCRETLISCTATCLETQSHWFLAAVNNHTPLRSKEPTPRCTTSETRCNMVLEPFAGRFRPWMSRQRGATIHSTLNVQTGTDVKIQIHACYQFFL